MTAKSAKSKKAGQPELVLEVGRQIMLMGGIDTDMHRTFSEQLNELVLESDEPVMVVLDSDGGEVYSGFGIYDAIRLAPVDVHVLVRGHAMSMAAVVSQAGRSRLATPHSMFMLHTIHYDAGMDRLYAQQNHAHVSNRMQQMIDAILVKRSKLTVAKLAELTKKDDYYLTADEALAHGLIDGIVG